MLVFLLSASGSCEVFRPYISTDTVNPQIQYATDTANSIIRAEYFSGSSASSGIEVKAVAIAEKDDRVKDKRKFVSYTASMNEVVSTPFSDTRSLPSN